ncbi:Gfo/Idh/MocA family protein [Paenibacillus silvisoli]|uniref:Gfo/Idh/MocA family protein n=1 Tax=Paenibacillus silvisoli TaxID=3110539 RepID=UPI002804C1A3|nr:Gfo/Idh/MocA family oxidoreductase [Paenibacillus silvisoli]
MTQLPIRLAIVGGNRGGTFDQSLNIFKDKIRLTAVCDLDEGVLKQWLERYPGAKGYTSYDRLLDDPDIDAVFLATPVPLHAKQAVAAMKAGKHVLSEVIAATSLEECWELVETVETTGLTYMLAENYCYMRPNMMVHNLVNQGLFGELTYAEGAYLHDCRNITHYADGSLTWRGAHKKDSNYLSYPTHSLGPIAQWFGINKPGGDELATMCTFTTQEASAHRYFQEVFGDDHPGAKKGYWKQGDSATALIQTKKSALIQLRMDVRSPRPHNMTHYALQGSNGAYESARHRNEDPLLWIKGLSPGTSVWEPGCIEAEWEPLWKHAPEYEHASWKKWKGTADLSGHGGGDFFILEEFSDAIIEKRRPAIDVYDAVTWSCVAPLSLQSVMQGNKPVSFPRFNKNSISTTE